MTEQMLSIMVVTYNRLPLTKFTIASLIKHTDYPFRLIVIDNDSTDGTVEYLNSELSDSIRSSPYCKSIDIHLNPINRGVAVGRNQGLKISDRYPDVQYLCTLDNDVELVPNWATDIVDILNTLPNFLIGINYEDVDYPVTTINGKTFKLKIRGNLGTACCVYKKELHDKIGFYDIFDRYGHEDALHNYRSRLAGYQIGYLTTSGKHLGSGENDVGEYREMKNHYGQQNLQIFYKYCQQYASGQKPLYVSFDEPVE